LNKRLERIGSSNQNVPSQESREELQMNRQKMQERYNRMSEIVTQTNPPKKQKMDEKEKKFKRTVGMVVQICFIDLTI